MRTERQIEEYMRGVRADITDRDELAYRWRLYGMDLPPRHNRDIGNDPIVSDFGAEKKIRAYIANIKQCYQEGIGLFLSAPTGMGKTRAITQVMRAAAQSGRSGSYFTALDFEWELKKTIGDKDYREQFEYKTTYTKYSGFLVIDDMGKEKVGDSWARSQFERIFKKRSDKRLPIIIATNLDWDSWCEEYGVSVSDVVRASLYKIKIFCANFRDIEEKEIFEMFEGKDKISESK